MAEGVGFEPTERFTIGEKVFFPVEINLNDVFDDIICGQFRCHTLNQAPPCTMASLRKRTGTQFWFACFTLPGGRRVQRSTGTSDRKLARQLAEQFEMAASTHRTAKQAQRVMADLHRHITGQTVDQTSVKDFFTAWLVGKKGALSTSSYDAYEAVADSFVLFMGERAHLETAHITATDVIKFRDFLATQVSVNSTNNRLKILRVALQQAWRDGKLEENPGKKVQSLKKTKGGIQRRAFTLEELKALMKEASGEWKGQILFGVYTGQRLGDIAQLSWDDIDLGKKILSLATQKTDRRQILPLAPAVVRWLTEAAAAFTGKPKGPLFPNAHGTISKSGKVGTLSNQFYAIMTKAGVVAARPNHEKKPDGKGRTAPRLLSELSFHSLRHTTTSMMKNSGVSPAFVQEFVGHDSKTVSQNYTHIELASLQEAVGAMPDLL